MPPNYKNEELKPMMVIRQSKMLLGARMVTIHLFFSVICAVFLVAFDGTNSELIRFQGFLWINLAEVMALFYGTLRWHNHFYLLQPDRILTSRGVFLRRQRFFAIKNIEAISVHQGVIGRLFNFGTLHLYAPTLNHRIKMFGINDPCHKEQLVEKLLPDAGGGSGKKREVLIVPGQRD